MSDETIGNYRLVRELGTGGMGTVYEAVDIMLERPVAIKMLRPEIASKPDLIERFRAEAVTLAKLHHPAVATLFAFLREGERFAMVMEFVRGRTLEGLLSSAGRLPPALAVDILRQTLDGVAHAHGMGVLHRDIKPANIMITDERAVKVTDFGIARILGASRMTREGTIIGTLEYIAPERIRGEEEDPRSDLYSAGVVLFELLTGRLPFVSSTDYGLIQAHLQQTPPELSALGVECPAPLQSILSKALAKAPKYRYQSAQEFRDALAAVVDAAPVLKPTRLAEVPAPGRRRRDWALAAAALVLVAAGIGAFVLLRSRSAPVEPPAVIATAPATPEPAPVAPPVLPPPVFLPRTEPLVVPRDVSKPAPQKVTSEMRTLPPAPKPDSAPAPPPLPEPVAPVPVAPVPVPVPAPAATAAAPEVRREPEPVPSPQPPRPKNIYAVHRLYVEKMDNGLDVHIKDEIRMHLPALRVVDRRADADAVMTGTVEKHDSTSSTVTRGMLGMKSGYSAAVSITDIDGANVLWSGEAGDARALVGAIKRGGPKKVAERIVGNLRKAMGR